MKENSFPHPLDADDDDDAKSQRHWQSDSANPIKAYQPLLKPSLRFAAFAAVVLAVGSVLTSVFPYGTQAYFASLTVFRVSGAVLVCALLGVLISFRIGFIRGRPARVPRRLATRFGGYLGFVLANMLGLVIAWGGLLWAGWEFGSGVIAVAIPVFLIGAGLLATMIVTHKGYLQAYAIGCLVAFVLQSTSFSNLATILLYGGGFGGPFGGGYSVRSGNTVGGFDMFSMSLGIVLTIVIASGLTSSAYVLVLAVRTQRQSEIVEPGDSEGATPFGLPLADRSNL